MDRAEFDKVIKACRFCLMCRHLCTVGNITYAETNTPRGQTLMLDCMGSEALEDTPENRKRAAEVLFACCYCGHCQNNCVSSYRHPDAIVAARAMVKDEDLPEKVKELRGLITHKGTVSVDPGRADGLMAGGPEQVSVRGRRLAGYGKEGADVLLYLGSFVSKGYQKAKVSNSDKPGEEPVDVKPGAFAKETQPSIENDRPREKPLAAAAIAVLDKAGADYTLFYEECGTGMYEYLLGLPEAAQAQLDMEIKKINELGPKQVVTLSPDDLRVLTGGVPGLDASALSVPAISFLSYVLELVKNRLLVFYNNSETMNEADYMQTEDPGRQENTIQNDDDPGRQENTIQNDDDPGRQENTVQNDEDPGMQGIKVQNNIKTVAFHDSDQGGRFLQDFDTPREVLKSIPGIRYKELFWSKGEAASAGESGLIRMLDPSLAEIIARKRMEQIEGRGIDILVTDSPEAKAQLEAAGIDGLQVQHIAEFVLFQIR